MVVLLDTTYAARAPNSGTGVYLQELQRALAQLEGVDVKPVQNPRRGAPAGGGLGSARNLLVDRWWLSAELPRLARAAGADVVHHPLPASARAPGVSQVITVHDLAFERLPDKFDSAFRVYARRSHRAAARAAAAVICVSETTAAEVVELWNVERERIVIARHGPGQALAAPPEDRDRSHFLYVGDDEPRKNLSVLTAAYGEYRELDPHPRPLVIAGSVAVNAESVTVERRVSPERLAELYAGALVLVHPSLYEGFGLTALEAMKTGTPVLAAEAPGLRETCGEAALYADPASPASFAAAMAQLAMDPAARDELAERGRRRVASFSWARCARSHLDAYSLAASRR